MPSARPAGRCGEASPASLAESKCLLLQWMEFRRPPASAYEGVEECLGPERPDRSDCSPAPRRGRARRFDGIDDPVLEHRGHPLDEIVERLEAEPGGKSLGEHEAAHHVSRDRAQDAGRPPAWNRVDVDPAQLAARRGMRQPQHFIAEHGGEIRLDPTQIAREIEPYGHVSRPAPS